MDVNLFVVDEDKPNNADALQKTAGSHDDRANSIY